MFTPTLAQQTTGTKIHTNLTVYHVLDFEDGNLIHIRYYTCKVSSFVVREGVVRLCFYFYLSKQDSVVYHIERTSLPRYAHIQISNISSFFSF